jgi:hypothetical protein
LPIGSSDREIQQTQAKALEPIRNEIAFRAAKQRLIETGVREVYTHAKRMLQEFEYEEHESAYSIELRTKGQVEKVLRRELNGTETEDAVRDRVHQIMEEAEGCV